MRDTGDMVSGPARLHAGIDLGSTAMKMLVIDDHGAEVAGAQVPTPWRVGEGGTTDIDAADLLASVRVLMGALGGVSAATPCHSPTLYAHLLLDGGRFSIDAEADERAIMATEGTLALDGQPLDPFTLYVLAPGAAPLLTGSGRAMLLGGQDFATPRHVWWNFVSSRPERIEQAKADWRAGRFALPPDDHDEFIPLPEVPKTVSYP